MGWLIVDGFDGMVVCVIGIVSVFGWMFDGLCDYGVFVLFYVLFVVMIGIIEGWVFFIFVGVVYVVQLSLYEGECVWFYCCIKGLVFVVLLVLIGNVLVCLYDSVVISIDCIVMLFECVFGCVVDLVVFVGYYCECVVVLMWLMVLFIVNVCVVVIFVVCFVGNLCIFWWFEIVFLMIVIIIGFVWYCCVECVFVYFMLVVIDDCLVFVFIVREQGQ